MEGKLRPAEARTNPNPATMTSRMAMLGEWKSEE
jgi:hypothetical protein